METIRQKLDRFIRKYYKNRLIKGILYSLALLLSLFLVMVLLEYFGYYGSVVRGVLFWSYLAATAGVLGYYVVVPLLKMLRLGKVISDEEAATIVGHHFPEIKDKLLNLLQLQKQDKQLDDTLLQAAIAQKTRQLSPLPFQQAVNLRQNRRYVKYAAIPAVIILGALLLSPTLLTAPSHRITHYNTYFERPAPFAFVVENERLEAVQHNDYELRVAIEGDAVPAEAYISFDGNSHRMRQVDKSHFAYQFRTLQRNCDFHLEAAGVVSPNYTLRVLPKPAVVDFSVQLSYPTYTGKENETLNNEGDLIVPQGTFAKWHFNTQYVGTLRFMVDNQLHTLVPDKNGRVSITLRAMQSFSYGFSATNQYAVASDTLDYAVSTIADALPMIDVQEAQDSALPYRLFFHGRVKDDYGFSRLAFRTVVTHADDTAHRDSTLTEIGLNPVAVQEFYYSTDLSQISLLPGDRLEYFFEVWDNDAIHGPKSATSQRFELKVPTEHELDQLLQRNSDEAVSKAQMSVSELKKLQEEINELMRKLVDKKELNWQDKQDLQQLAEKQKEVKKMLQNMQQQLQENKQLEQKYKDQSEKLLQKQQELDRLMNEVMNDEMKEMMKEIDKLMKEMDKKSIQEQLDKLKMDNEELEKQLDQNIELMKRLELEKKVEDAVQKAEKLSEKQRELSNKTEEANNGEKRKESLEQQKQLSEQFEQLKQDINQIKQDYKQLDPNLDFKVDREQLKKIDDNQQGAENSLQKGKQKDASKQQKDAADHLEQLSEQLAEAQQDIEQSDLAEDSEMVRHLLKNLVHLSFRQEELIDTLRATYIQDPKYQSIILSQNRIKEDFANVEDSLRAIAGRQLAVAVVINKNVAEINSQLGHSLNGLLDMNQSFYGAYKNTKASQSMQYTMTSFNNLALVLAESLDKMQDQMRQNQQKKSNGSCKNPGMKKQGSCSNPGKGKPSAKSMKQMQNELNRQMEALKKQLDKQGNNKANGRKKIGDKGQAQLSEEFARMAAQQETIRRMMQQYGQEMKEQDAGNAKMAKEIDQMLKQMEQTETDLVNRVITQQTISRQQQILTRMLEHEKAEMQREKEQRRESREGKEMPHQPSPTDMERFKNQQERGNDMLRRVPPTLSPFYKEKVNEYFYSL